MPDLKVTPTADVKRIVEFCLDTLLLSREDARRALNSASDVMDAMNVLMDVDLISRALTSESSESAVQSL